MKSFARGLTIVALSFVFLLAAGLSSACSPAANIKLPAGSEAEDLALAANGSRMMLRFVENDQITAQCREMPRAVVNWQVKELGGLSGNLVDFTPDGIKVAIAERDKIGLWSAADGQQLAQFSVNEIPLDQIPVGDIEEGQALYILQIKFRSDGTLVVMVGRQAEPNPNLFLEIWDADGTRLGKPILLTGGAHNAQWWRPFDAEGRLAAYRGSLDQIGIIDIDTQQERQLPLADQLFRQNEDGYVTTLALSPDGTQLALGLSRDMWVAERDLTLSAEQGLVVLVNIESGQISHHLPAPAGTSPSETPVYLAYNSNQTLLAASLLDSNALLLYNLAQPEREPEVLCRGEKCCRRKPLFSPDGDSLIALCRQSARRFELP